MDENTRDLLIDLNRTFYQSFAQQFSATRQRLQPGVAGILDRISHHESVLELGCGNGQFAKELFSRGHLGPYTGLDSNADFVKIAQNNLPGNGKISLVLGDLTSTAWHKSLPANQFDLIIAFAVLHHIPDSELRKRIIQKIGELLPPGGRFIHSEWQLLNSLRLRNRIQPWELIGITSEEVEDGDYLIDWRSGGQGLRYVHVFGKKELTILAAETGFVILDSYFSDGEGGNLGMYQIWERL